MNFLLYMLGRGISSRGIRPSPRELIRARAARQAMDGRRDEALEGYRRLVESGGATTLDWLICGHLCLVCQQDEAAEDYVSVGLERLLESRREDPADFGRWAMEESLDAAGSHFDDGRYSQAIECLCRARALSEVALSATGVLVVARDQARRDATAAWGAMGRLVKLGDLTLRLLARAYLAREVARTLRAHRLGGNMSGGMVATRRVDRLLGEECRRLERCAARLPGFAEMHYRLGLTAGAAGQQEIARRAFAAVLEVHRAHVPSALRLGLILGPKKGMEVLHAALRVPDETMRLFGVLAQMVGEGGTLDAAVERMCSAHAPAAIIRGNMALALSEVGLLDETRACWREPAAV